MGSTDRPGLIRGLGFGSAFSVVAGSTIGSGIFLVASDITRSLPSPLLALSVWFVAGLISLLGGLSLAELGSMFPGAGGQYVYLREAFGRLPAFLYGWTLFLVIQTGSIAAVSVAFSQFSGEIIPLPGWGLKLVATAIVVALTGINLLGVKKGAGVLDVLTSLKVFALLVIAGIGLFLPGASGAGLTQLGSFTAPSYGVALIAAFWAFDGWNNLSFVAGEVINPKRNIPLGMIAGISAVALLYLGVNYAYYQVLAPSAVAASNFAAADFARALGGETGARLVVVAVILSTLGCVNGMILAGPRVTYAVASDGAMPPSFAYVHPKFRVPSVALIVQMVWATILVWSGTFDQLFTYVVSAAFVFYGLTVTGLIVLRFKRPGLARPYRVPLYPVVPILYVVFTVAFVANAVFEKPLESLAGLVIVGMGVPAYFVFRRQNARPGPPLPDDAELTSV